LIYLQSYRSLLSSSFQNQLQLAEQIVTTQRVRE
jgi:hypothetical protein